MSLSDVLYPGNPEMREKIIRKSQELLELMKNNFRATNVLTEIVNKHLDTSFSPISLNEKATVKQNCDVMIRRVNEIQAKVAEKNEELKRKLELGLYEELQKLSLNVKSLNTVKVAVAAICHIGTFVLVAFLTAKKHIFATITNTLCKVAAGFFASLVLGIIVDLVVSAILGYLEREELKKNLEEHETALKKFRPASEEYYDAIMEVKVLIKFKAG